MLASVLLPEDPFRKTLVELCLRMTNQVIVRLQDNGLVDARDRYYVGMPLTGSQFWSSFLSVAPLAPLAQGHAIDQVFSQMFHFAGHRLEWCDRDVITYLTSRPKLLNGTVIDSKKW